MRLNQASDYALRILMVLAGETQAITVKMLADKVQLVKSHAMKIVAKLVKAGILKAGRGRHGGVALAKAPDTICLGDVVRLIEADFAIVECMQEAPSSCVFAPRCKLRGVMHDATSAFLSVLDGKTLASILP